MEDNLLATGVAMGVIDWALMVHLKRQSSFTAFVHFALDSSQAAGTRRQHGYTSLARQCIIRAGCITVTAGRQANQLETFTATRMHWPEFLCLLAHWKDEARRGEHLRALSLVANVPRHHCK